MTSQLSKQGAAFIAHFESIVLEAYPDPGTGGDPWTIGIGSTRHDGFGPVRKGDRITLERAIVRFRKTMEKTYGPTVTRAIQRDLAQHEFDAAASFHYNTGAVRSGSVDDKFNRGDDRAALATWAAYKKAAGKTMAGLVRRRAAEIKLWRYSDYGQNRIAIKDTYRGQARTIAPANLPWDLPEPPAPVINLEFPPITPPLPVRRPHDNFLLTWFTSIWRWLNAENV